MELQHLRCFLGVAGELRFARAAERLHVEQSPLSRAIKELEEDLGAQLFVRDRQVVARDRKWGCATFCHAAMLFAQSFQRSNAAAKL